MAQTVEQALQQARLYSDEVVYAFVRLPAQAITLAAAIVAQLGEPFCALLVDKDEVTLVLPDEALETFAPRLRDHEIAAARYRLITFDVALEPTLVGFMARVSAALAEADVPLFAFAAYTRDHVFVPVEHFDAALAALRRLGAR